jgi:hypothetical protein
MADSTSTRLARALIEFGVDNTEFKAVITDTAKQLAGLTKNFRETGTDLDGLVKGMSAAGKEASSSGQMIAGMSRVGREELARLTDAGKQPVSVFQQIGGVLGPMQAAIAGAFSVSAVIGFAKGVGEFAGHMVDLSDETQISTSRLQAWNYLLTGAGLTVDDFTTSVQQMQKRLADGDDSAVGAVTRLGLQVDKLLQENPDDAFIDIAEAVAKIGNQGQRTALMFDLFGRSGSQMLRVVSAELGKTIDDIEHSGAVIDDYLIRKADQFDDAWSQAWIRFRAGAVQAVDEVRQAFMQYQPENSVTPKLPGAPNLGAIGAGPTIAGPTPAELRAMDEQAAKMRENIAVYEAHQKKLAELAEQLSGQKAIAEIKDLQAAFQSLTPTQQANKDVISNVLEQYTKLRQEVAIGVVPVLDNLFQQSLARSTDKARGFAQQLMLTHPEVQALESSTEALIPPLLDTNTAINMSTQQLAIVSYQYAGAAEAQGKFTKTTVSAWTEVDAMARSFEQLANISGKSMGEVTRGLGSVVGAMSAAHTGWGSLTKGFKNFSSGGGLSSILGGLSGIVGGIGGIVAAAQAAVAGIKALFNAFKSEETKVVNKPRDQFQMQFGSTKDAGGANLIGLLMDQLFSEGDADGEAHAHALFQQLQDADTGDKFKAAQQSIADVLARGGREIQMFASGGIATRPTFGVFGESGPEAVIPLDRLSSVVGGLRDATQTIILKLDGRVLTQTVVRGMPRELNLAGVAF